MRKPQPKATAKPAAKPAAKKTGPKATMKSLQREVFGSPSRTAEKVFPGRDDLDLAVIERGLKKGKTVRDVEMNLGKPLSPKERQTLRKQGLKDGVLGDDASSAAIARNLNKAAEKMGLPEEAFGQSLRSSPRAVKKALRKR